MRLRCITVCYTLHGCIEHSLGWDCSILLIIIYSSTTNCMMIHFCISADSVAAANFGFGTSVAVGIAVVVTGIIALIVGFLTGILVYYCISNYRLQSAKPESSFQHQPQTIPSSNLLQQTGPEYAEVHAKKIELKENMAYVHVQRRELRANVLVQHWFVNLSKNHEHFQVCCFLCSTDRNFKNWIFQLIVYGSC